MKLISTKTDNESLLKEETLFHVANGYLGIRGNLEEGSEDPESVRGCYINGFYDTVELSYPERLYGFPQHAQRMINLPDVQDMKITLDGYKLEKPVEQKRILDTSEGVAKRYLRYDCKKGFINLMFTRIASFTRPWLFLTILNIESDNVSGELKIQTGINCNVQNYTNPDDPRVAAEAIKHFNMQKAQKLNDGGFVQCGTTGSGLEFAVVQRLSVKKSENSEKENSEKENESIKDIKTETYDNGTETTVSITLIAGESLTIEKYAVFSDSRRQPEPLNHALDTADKCIQDSSEKILKEQKAYLDEFWSTAGIRIGGSKEIQDALDFNIYQLLQSTGRDGISSIAAKGISGEGYEGHYFWDSEIYIFPFFLFTKPEIARAMLDFRYNILDGAKEHARIMGHKRGALYPWRTISGSECSSYFPSGSAQYHINGDIAHAFMQYRYATGDLEYMAEKGSQVLVETARLWLDTGHYDSDGLFNIYTVTGPDEYTCLVNNNYYTNRCAQSNLLGAAEICKELWQKDMAKQVEKTTGITPEEVELFEHAAAAMKLPYDERFDINAQDDSFLQKAVWDLSNTPEDEFPLLLHYHPMQLYRHQVNKQADTVLAHFLFYDDVKESTMRNSFDYYEKITTHDSSLSRCVFCIMAARLDMHEKACSYFDDVLWTDIKDSHGNVKDGLHTANLGGSWLAMVMGFLGMRLDKNGLHFKILQPKLWESTTLRIRYLENLIKIQMNNKKTVITLEKGKSVDIFVNSMQIHLDEASIKVIQSQEFMLET